MTMWRPVVRSAARQVTRTRPLQLLSTRHKAAHAEESAGEARGFNSKILVREARDTLDLIDQLLSVLGPTDSAEPGFVFFDLDETLITRDTCLIDGLGSTRDLMSRLEDKLGPASETLRIIHSEMERDYYSADPRLVDPLLARVIRALKIQGHSVYGLTSNALDPVHAPKILETLALYKIRFSATDVRGELPRSGALVMDHPVCRGVIFSDNQQTVRHDKGQVIAEFVSLLLHNARRASAEGRDGPAPVPVKELDLAPDDAFLAKRALRKCVLVDNTSKKCQKAGLSFAQHPASQGLLELHTLHFTEAENLVDSPDALMQLRRILGRLKARGTVGVDLVAEDLLVAPSGNKHQQETAAGLPGSEVQEAIITQAKHGSDLREDGGASNLGRKDPARTS